MYRVRQIPLFYGKCFKRKTTEYFLKFLFLFESTILSVNNGKYIHTYIIGHYNPSVRITGLVSHTTYVVCVNFIHKWRDLQFKVDSERHIFLRNFSWHLITHRVFARNLLRGNRCRNTFRISF